MLQSRGLCLAILALGLVAICPLSPAGAADFKSLPDDTELVLTVNLKQIRTSELVRSEKDALDEPRALLNRLSGDLPVLKCLQEVGVDFFRDLTSISFAGPRGKKIKTTFLIVEGDFAALKLNGKLAEAAKAKSETIAITTWSGATVYEIGAANKRHYAALVGNSTLIAATEREALADALARADGSKKSGLSKALGKLLDTIDEKPSIALVTSGSALGLLVEGTTLPNAANIAAALKTCDAVSASITLTKEIQFQLSLYARDEDTAKKVAESSENSLQTIRGLARQKAKEDNKFLPIADAVDSLRVKNRGPIISLRWEATLDVLEKLFRD
jgi:hypothetical protein